MNAVAMAFDMRSQFRCGIVDHSGGEAIDNPQVAGDSDFPFGLFHTLSKSLKEDMQQIAEGHEWGQTARHQQGAVKLNIEVDPCLEIPRQPEAVHESTQTNFDQWIDSHLSDDMGQDTCFKDDATVDELLRVHLQQTGMEAEVFRDSPHVHLADSQSDARTGFHDPQKLERFRRFSHAQTTNPKSLRPLRFGGQSVSGYELIGDDELFDLLRSLIADFRSAQRGHSRRF